MASKEVLDSVEKTLDTVEETIETLERIPKVNLNGTTKKQQIIILCVTAGVSALATGLIVHLVNKKRIEAKYEAIARKEIADAKDFYSRLHKTSKETLTPEQALENLHGKDAVEAMRRYQTGVTTEAPVDTEQELSPYHPQMEEIRRIPPDITVGNDEWDYELELKVREENPDRPYIIHEDEYLEGEKDYSQSTLTYFEGDNTLADDDIFGMEGVYQNVDEVVGEDNLLRFGHGARDPNIVFVRNDVLSIDYEIARSNGKYAKEVLGFDDEDEEVKRTPRHGGRKFNRGHDD